MTANEKELKSRPGKSPKCLDESLRTKYLKTSSSNIGANSIKERM
jgi:hypothetical protein